MGENAVQSLDGQWLFQIDRDEKGEERGYHDPSRRPEGWRRVPVPGSWDAYLPELFGYAGHAWYRRAFRPRAGWKGGRIHLRFQGANYETTVWLGGRRVGSHAGGFDPFELDITEDLDWQRENTLAVRVDNWPRSGRVPSSLGGWWNYGGIYRSVELRALPAVRIADVFVSAEPGQGARAAPVRATVTVMNESGNPARLDITATVTRGRGTVSASGNLRAQVELEPGAAAVVPLSGRIEDAGAWSPASPTLYTMHVTLEEHDRVLHTVAAGFGVRRFEVRGTELCLNGEPVAITGFNRHEEYAGSARVDPGGVLEADLRAIKEMGGTMVRMHYQAHPALYDLADRLGLLVFAEIPLWGVGQGDGTEWSDPAIRKTAETMLETLIRTLRNHPSVVIWSVGNECGTDREEARPLIARLAELARSLDGTRPVAYVGFLGTQEKVYDLVDLPCHNQYFGMRAGDLGRHLDAVHALAPTKPLLATEFGHEAVRGLRGEGYGTEDEQSAVLEGNWQAIRERGAFMPGGLIWCLADYRHMPCGPDHDWMNRDYFCHGVMTLDRKPKKACEAVRRMWRRT